MQINQKATSNCIPQIRRGTTPTLTINIGVGIKDISVLRISFSQSNEAIIIRTLTESELASLEDSVIKIRLSQEDTLQLKAGKCTMQAKMKLADMLETVLASPEKEIKVLDIKDEEVI